MTFPLTTKRLAIRPLAQEHLETFVDYRQDPEVARYQSWDPGFSVTQGMEIIESQAGVSFPETNEWLQLAVEQRDSQRLVGDLAIHKLVEPASYEIGFTLARSEQGQGYAYEAASRLLDFLFVDSAANRVIATPDSRNEKSIALLLKLGFAEDPSKSWIEEFKGETVKVLFFELVRPAPQEFASSHPAGQ